MAMEFADISQSELARRVGISPQAIQHIISRKTQHTRYLVEISKELGVNPGWLGTGYGYMLNEQPPPPTPKTATGTIKGDHVVNPTDFVRYDDSNIPVFMAFTYKSAAENTKIFDNDIDSICRIIVEQTETALWGPKDLVGENFHVIEGEKPDGYFPRPHYLAGVLKGYGVCFPMGELGTSMGITGNDTVHVNPHKRAQLWDRVLVWTHYNSFIAGLLESITKEKLVIVLGWDAKFGRRRVTISSIAVKEIHALVGVEFDDIPKSNKILLTAKQRPQTEWEISELDPTDPAEKPSTDN